VTSSGVISAAPSNSDGYAGGNSFSPSRPSRSTTRSSPTSSPIRTVAWLYDAASARMAVTGPCDSPSKFCGDQIVPFGIGTSIGASSISVARL
jgi:hypothetical protein